MSSIPDRFPATGTDVGVAITRAVTIHRIGLRLAFDEHLDADRLERAARLALDAEPVVGCSFVSDVARPYWSRIHDLDASGYFSSQETDDCDRAMNEFQAGEVPDIGPQAGVHLVRKRGGDEVGLKVSHVLADGQAAKQYAYLLADTYTRLAEDPEYRPVPNLTPRPTGADVWKNLTPEQRRDAKKAKSWSKPTWEIPAKANTGRGLTYVARSIGPDEFSALRAYGKARDATVNDMMLTAVFRACVDAFDPPEGVAHSLMCTADLRRYLPNREGLPVSNISISGPLDLERVDGEIFAQTLARVRERMAVWAKACYGAYPTYQAERMASRSYRLTKLLMGTMLRLAGGSGKTYPFFTNIGVVDDGRVSFSGLTPIAGHMYGPTGAGGSIVPVISTYRDTLTVCMGFCEPDCDRAMVEGILDSAIGELPTPG